MRKRAWYLGKLVTHQNMVDAFDDVEDSTHTLTKDLLFEGVLSGHTVAEAAVPDLTVSVSSGTSFSPNGERIRTAGESIVDCAFDHLEASTAVADPAKSKILSIFILFDTLGSDPQTDANGDTANFLISESYQFKVVQGAEALSPTPGAAIAGGVLLAYVTLIFGQTAILDADIDSDAREDLIVLTGTPFGTSGTGGRYGSYIAALQAIVSRYNSFLTGGGDAAAASAISYAGSGATKWADTTGLGAGTVQATITAIVSVLGATASGAGNSGGYKIGVEQDVGGGSGTIAASSLDVRLKALRTSSNLAYTGSLSWQDATAVASGSVQATLDGFITTLNAFSSTSLNGARKIGLYSTGNFTAGSIYGGFQQLAATTAGNDGAKRIGTEATGGLAGATVRAQLDEIQTAKAPKASPTFTGTITADKGNFTGELTAPRLSPLRQDVGVIAANTQITDAVGVVECRSPGTNADYNLALPEPASGFPVLFLKFRGGGAGSGRRVWLTTTALIGTSPPTDYYAYWEASSNVSAGAVMYWDGTRWRMISPWNLTTPTGGGALID